MMECQRKYDGKVNDGRPTMDAAMCFKVLHAKLQISLNLAKEFMDLEIEMKGREESFNATKTYLPYMESDQLAIATGVELEDLDETIDLLKLRITEDMVKDGKIECTPEQYEYLKMVKWYEE